MTHEVYARREGEHAVLSCAICKSQAVVDGGNLDRANRFIAEHRLCLDFTR